LLLACFDLRLVLLVSGLELLDFALEVINQSLLAFNVRLLLRHLTVRGDQLLLDFFQLSCNLEHLLVFNSHRSIQVLQFLQLLFLLRHS